MASGEGEIWEGGGRSFRVEKVVGNGAFGIVWRAHEENGNGELYAIKRVLIDRRYHNRELEMMKALDHECVIRLHHHFEKAGRKRDETYLHLVMDFLPETIRSASLACEHRRIRSPTKGSSLQMSQGACARPQVIECLGSRYPAVHPKC
jgi:serine/threonine protein kinase